MNKFRIIIAGAAVVLSSVAIHAAEEVNKFEGAKGIYQPTPEGGKWYWRLEELPGIKVVSAIGRSGHGFSDGMLWAQNVEFCKKPLGGTTGWRMPTHEDVAKLNNLGKAAIKENLEYHTFLWTDKPSTVDALEAPNYVPTENPKGRNNGLCIFDAKLAAQPRKPDKKVASDTPPQKDSSSPKSKPASATAGTVENPPLLSTKNTKTTTAAPQEGSKPPATESEAAAKTDRKLYPFSTTQTYASTYRNTSKERALETLQSERVRLEPTFLAHAASWKVSSVSEPICEQSSMGKYWKCTNIVSYEGMSFHAPNTVKKATSTIQK